MKKKWRFVFHKIWPNLWNFPRYLYFSAKKEKVLLHNSLCYKFIFQRAPFPPHLELCRARLLRNWCPRGGVRLTDWQTEDCNLPPNSFALNSLSLLLVWTPPFWRVLGSMMQCVSFLTVVLPFGSWIELPQWSLMIVGRDGLSQVWFGLPTLESAAEEKDTFASQKDLPLPLLRLHISMAC